jgi:hypothetical protein
MGVMMATFLGGTIFESGPGNWVYQPNWRDEDDGMVFSECTEEFGELDEALAEFYRQAREEGVKCTADIYEYTPDPETRHFMPQTEDPHEGTD